MTITKTLIVVSERKDDGNYVKVEDDNDIVVDYDHHDYYINCDKSYVDRDLQWLIINKDDCSGDDDDPYYYDYEDSIRDIHATVITVPI